MPRAEIRRALYGRGRRSAEAHYNQFLLSEEQREHVNVVLVSPRNPLNIGAAARAMANFGFARLTVVAPYEVHWREAKSAVGAEALLQNARREEHLAEAVADCTLVVGTGTVGRRKPEQAVVALPGLGGLIEREMQRGGRVALVFGSEKRGLTREDFALCHVLAEIPTDPRQPSMNLGQAVAVCLYELAARSSHSSRENTNTARMGHAACPEGTRVGHPESGAAHEAAPVTMHDLELLAGVVEETMQAAEYSPAIMREANRHDLHVLLRRLTLEKRDARRILGLLRRVLWRLRHPRDRANRGPLDITPK